MVMRGYTKSELMKICKEGIDKYYYKDGKVLNPLTTAKKYFFEQTNNQYAENTDTYKLYIKCFCEYGREIVRKNGYEPTIWEFRSS